MDPQNPFEAPFDEPEKSSPKEGPEAPFFHNSQSPYGSFQGQMPLEQVPNAVAVLVLGIMSLVFLFCYGLGFIFAIIALGIAGKGKRVYRNEPARFQPGSYNMLKSGRICAIISLSVGIFFIAILIIAIIFGVLSESGPNYY